MDLFIAQIISMTLYKLASLATGLTLCYMGYRLFMAGVWGNAGNAEGNFGSNKIVITQAAPGTFFILMGAVILGLTIAQGLHFKTDDTQKETSHATMETKPALPD